VHQNTIQAVQQIRVLHEGLVACANLKISCLWPCPSLAGFRQSPSTWYPSERRWNEAAASLGNLPPSPFAILSFLALPVIPELRLTDLGLVDVTEFKLLG